MKHFLAAFLAGAILAVPTLTRADDHSGLPSAAEAPFTKAIASDLSSRFPSPADAEKAGYLRYTAEDDTGAISYANRMWTSPDAQHPSQLWYDAKGRLIGADFSVPGSTTPPHLFGVNPARWTSFPMHEHYGISGPGGVRYGATSAKKIASVGGDPAKPAAADIVALGLAKTPADVAFVFVFPKVWDLPVWVIPNAAGAFADKNPDVKPVSPPKSGMGM